MAPRVGREPVVGEDTVRRFSGLVVENMGADALSMERRRDLGDLVIGVLGDGFSVKAQS